MQINFMLCGHMLVHVGGVCPLCCDLSWGHYSEKSNVLLRRPLLKVMVLKTKNDWTYFLLPDICINVPDLAAHIFRDSSHGFSPAFEQLPRPRGGERPMFLKLSFLRKENESSDDEQKTSSED